MGNVAIEVYFIGFNKALRTKHAEICEQIFNRPSIRIDRFRALPLELEPFNKGTSGWMYCDTGVICPRYFCFSHDFFLVDYHFHTQ